MASVSIKRGTKEEIDATNVNDGQILFTTDQAQNKIYADVGEVRKQIGGTVEVIDNLTSNNTDKALSANMGKTLSNSSNISYSNSTSGLSATNVQSAIDEVNVNKSNVGHTHDDRYYTEREVNTKLSGKSNTGHTHDDRYYTESEVNNLLTNMLNNLNSVKTLAYTYDTNNLQACNVAIYNIGKLVFYMGYIWTKTATSSTLNLISLNTAISLKKEVPFTFIGNANNVMRGQIKENGKVTFDDTQSAKQGMWYGMFAVGILN